MKDFSWYLKIINRTSRIQVVPAAHKTLRHWLICIASSKILLSVSIRSKDRGTNKINRSKDSVKSITLTTSNLLRQTTLALMFQWASQMSMWVCLSSNSIRHKSQLKCLSSTAHKVMMIGRSTRVVHITSTYRMKRLMTIMKKQKSPIRTGTFYKM